MIFIDGLRRAIIILMVLCCTFITFSCQQSAKETEANASEDGANAAETSKENKESPGLDAVPVAISVADTGSISSYLLLSSTIETERTVDVYPLQMGVVKSLRVEEGDKVRRGQALCVLVDDEYRLAAEKAELNYEKSVKDFERFKRMLDKSLISQEEYDNARFAMRDAEIEHNRAKVALAHTRVKAPISGVIAERIVRLGDRVQQSSKLFTIVNMDDKQVKVHVPEKNAWLLKKEQQAKITSDFMPNREFSGAIARIAPVVSRETGTVTVTIMMDEKYEDLRPGMFVNVLIQTDTHVGSVLVPKDAIVYENGLPYVFTVTDTLANRKSLKIGFTNPDYVESVGGVSSGDSLIVVGQSGLKDKAKVRVLPRDMPVL